MMYAEETRRVAGSDELVSPLTSKEKGLGFSHVPVKEFNAADAERREVALHQGMGGSPSYSSPGAMGPEEGPSPGAERGICPEGLPAIQLGAEEAKRPGLGRFKSQQHALPDFSQVVRRRSRETRNRNRKGRASSLLTARLWLL